MNIMPMRPAARRRAVSAMIFYELRAALRPLPAYKNTDVGWVNWSITSGFNRVNTKPKLIFLRDHDDPRVGHVRA